MEIEVEVSISSASQSIWFLHWLKIFQGLDDADRREWGGEVGVGDAGDTDESSVARRWLEWRPTQGVEGVTDNGIVSDQKAAI